MELLLHYCWRHRLFAAPMLHTTTGLTVEIIDPGLHNHDAGPDFFNAKLRIGGQLWVGNVEMHESASGWLAHHHDQDAAYDNVILHVCSHVDTDIMLRSGRLLSQMEVSIPTYVADNYRQLLAADRYPPCHGIIPELPPLLVHAWMSTLSAERLEQKTQAIAQQARRCSDDWEQTFFVSLARSFGFGINSDAFEQWARSLPLNIAAHQRDDRMLTEALFLGQAGMLDDAESADEYQSTLQGEYRFLQHKYHLQPIDRRQWRYMRLRPQNFPQIRIIQLMNLYLDGHLSLRRLVEQDSADELLRLWQTGADGYWLTHYTFGKPSRASRKQLTVAARESLIINAAVPMLFAYGRHQGSEELCNRAFDMLEQLRVEDNNIVRLWAECGLKVDNAYDTQALIQLKKQYCDRHECLRCRFGYEYMKHSNAADLLAEDRHEDVEQDPGGQQLSIDINTTTHPRQHR